MTVETTSTLSNSIRAQYAAAYAEAVYAAQLYHRLAMPVPGLSMDQAIQGSSVVVPFLAGMSLGVTALSQTADVTPQILKDATASITPTSRGEALQWSEQLDIQTFTNYAQERIKKIGENQAESIDLLAQAAACQGTWVERAVARASLDAGTASHRASDSLFRLYQAMFATLKAPGFIDIKDDPFWVAIMSPFVFHDVAESGNVDTIGLYQDKSIHLNFNLGKIGPFALIVSPWAKVYGGAGADNATNVADTLSTAASRLDKTFVTTSDDSASILAGRFWTVGTEETANTFYPENEQVRQISAATTTVTFVGQGENGGFRFDHASGTAVRNADSVYSIVFGGPKSLVHVYAPEVGEFGEFVPPHVTGVLHQFAQAGWKYYGGYGRLTENRLLRAEVSVSYEA